MKMTHILKGWKTFQVAIAYMLFCFTTVQWDYGAQNSPTNGTLTGTIRDVSGAVVPGAVVNVRSVDTNQTLRTSSTDDGSYRFAALPVGEYEIHVEIPGFTPYVNPNVTIILGRTLVLDVRLNPA